MLSLVGNDDRTLYLKGQNDTIYFMEQRSEIGFDTIVTLSHAKNENCLLSFEKYLFIH